MKFSKIARLAKRTKTAILMDDEDGMQWLSVGGSAYKLDGMPPLDADTVLTVMGISDDARDKWYAADRGDADTDLLKNDTEDEEEITAEDAGITVIFDGKLLMPIYTMDGLLWIDVELLAPTEKKEMGYRRFYIRERNGARMIAVKEGMILTAVIMECKVEDTDLADALKILVERCRAEELRKISLKMEPEGTVEGYDPEEE